MSLCIFLSDVLEVNDGQKRRRLEAAGQENRSPKPSSSGRLAELETKPDTPMVPSVRSRVQQLTQRREGNLTFTVEAGMLVFYPAHFNQRQNIRNTSQYNAVKQTAVHKLQLLKMACHTTVKLDYLHSTLGKVLSNLSV